MRSLLLVLLCALPLAARAADLPCGPAEPGTIRLDGLTDDWSEVEGLDPGGQDPNLSFSLRCNVMGKKLYLLIDVRDSYVVRTKLARPGEDHVELSFGSRRLLIFPGDAAAIPSKVVWAPGKPAKEVKVVSALQERGWAIELALPLAAVPGWRPNQPRLPFAAQVADCDSKAALKTERTAEARGHISFSDGAAAFDAFLKDRRLAARDIYFDRTASLGRAGGARLLLAGRYLAAIADGYAYVELPFSDRRDLKDARLVDLAGDRREALVLHYVERGGGGAREVLAVYRPEGDGIRRVFAAEVGKSQGASRLETRISFAKRGKATDLVLEAKPAVGFTQASFGESEASDMIPILRPWGDERRARYQFIGAEYRQAP